MADTATGRVKLMFCIDFLCTEAAGTENQLIKMINNLDRTKYQAYLLCLRDTVWLAQNRSRLKCSVKAFNYNEFEHGDPRNPRALWRMYRHIKKVAPDIFVAFFKVSYILGVFAARLAGVKTIISTRRDYGLWLDRKGIYALRLANRFLKGMVTNSRQVKELVCSKEHYDRSRVHVICNGIEAWRFDLSSGPDLSLKASLGIPADDRVVGIVAGLRPMKNHKTFLDAAERILGIRDDVSFIIIGDGAMRDELASYAEGLGIAKHVRFTGRQTDVPRYLSLLDVGVNCSANEGMSNAVMEYMAAGVPCVVSDAGGNPELIENGVNGYTFPLGDDGELCRLVVDLLNSAAKSREFAAKSREMVRSRLTVEKMIAEYDRLFERMRTLHD